MKLGVYLVQLIQGRPLFKSGLTRNIFNGFINQLIQKKARSSIPYVYVENGPLKIKYLAQMSDSMSGNAINAVTLGEHGDVEILSTEEK